MLWYRGGRGWGEFIRNATPKRVAAWRGTGLEASGVFLGRFLVCTWLSPNKSSCMFANKCKASLLPHQLEVAFSPRLLRRRDVFVDLCAWFS
jgi:hypothetical protein